MLDADFGNAKAEGTSGVATPAEVGIPEICAEATNYFATGKADHYFYHNGVLKDGPYDAVSHLLGGANAHLNVSVFNPNREDASSAHMTQIWRVS